LFDGNSPKVEEAAVFQVSGNGLGFTMLPRLRHGVLIAATPDPDDRDCLGCKLSCCLAVSLDQPAQCRQVNGLVFSEGFIEQI
jgi:hypothetical protein